MSLFIRYMPLALGGGGGGGGGATLTMGAFDGQAGAAEGASIVASQLFMQSASATVPGLVNLTTQSFAGNKTIISGNDSLPILTLQSTPSQSGIVFAIVDSSLNSLLESTDAGDLTILGTFTADNFTGSSSGPNSGDVSLNSFFGSTPNPVGISLSGQEIQLQPANATNPGSVSTTTQTFAGNKTFTGTITASNFSGSLSGTNTGDVTLAAFGSTPNANAASLSGQVLNLQPADGTNPGGVSTTTQAFAGAKTFNTSVLSPIFSTNAASPASTGSIRLSNEQPINWRNFADTADIGFYVNVGDAFIFDAAVNVNGTVTGSNLSGDNTGDVTLTPFGSTPNANGASLSAQELTLQPANGTNPGGVSTTTQTFAGVKTFLSPVSIGSAGGTTGALNLLGTTSGTVTVTTAAAAGTWTLTLPTTDGDAGQILQTNGSGVTTWVTPTAFVVPTIQRFTSGTAQTYTTPTSPRTPLYLRVRMVGGGGGGGQSGSAGGTNGATGDNTVFGSSLLTANGGGGGARDADGAVGGSFTVSGPAVDAGSCVGGSGGGTLRQSGTAVNSPALNGPSGGDSFFGGAGAGGSAGASGNGQPGAANTGGGGGGGYATSTNSVASGAGGGGGGFVDAIIASPSATYTYTVGGGGANGIAGTGGADGGDGGTGFIVVEEHYQ